MNSYVINRQGSASYPRCALSESYPFEKFSACARGSGGLVVPNAIYDEVYSPLRQCNTV